MKAPLIVCNDLRKNILHSCTHHLGDTFIDHIATANGSKFTDITKAFHLGNQCNHCVVHLPQQFPKGEKFLTVHMMSGPIICQASL